MNLERKLVKDIIHWDVWNWSRCLPIWEKELHDRMEGKLGLELGSRQGGLSLWLALKGFRVICSDIGNPEKHARALHKKYGVEYLVTYSAINAVDIPFESYFDVIVVKSVIGGVGRNGRKELQYQMFDSIYRALKPGGRFFFAENIVGSYLHEMFRKRFVEWGSSWRYVTIGELKEFLAPFSDYKLTPIGFLAVFGRNELQRTILGLLDRLIEPIIPKRMRYIAVCTGLK